ncbi:MAG: PD-(D/E)XK nuclease-like domain-containing protein, partial [Nitrosomonas sp.]|nr:PD-(D/E)XK nuclease-like domain-containing protein [Nitrosomonas sp.]
IQVGHYVDIVEQVQGAKIDNYYFIAQEKSGPYGIKVFRMNRQVIEYCLQARRDLLNRVAVAIETQEFPCYPEIVEDVVIPSWVGNDNSFMEVG